MSLEIEDLRITMHNRLKRIDERLDRLDRITKSISDEPVPENAYESGQIQEGVICETAEDAAKMFGGVGVPKVPDEPTEVGVINPEWYAQAIAEREEYRGLAAEQQVRIEGLEKELTNYAKRLQGLEDILDGVRKALGVDIHYDLVQYTDDRMSDMRFMETRIEELEKELVQQKKKSTSLDSVFSKLENVRRELRRVGEK